MVNFVNDLHILEKHMNSLIIGYMAPIVDLVKFVNCIVQII